MATSWLSFVKATLASRATKISTKTKQWRVTETLAAVSQPMPVESEIRGLGLQTPQLPTTRLIFSTWWIKEKLPTQRQATLSNKWWWQLSFSTRLKITRTTCHRFQRQSRRRSYASRGKLAEPATLSTTCRLMVTKLSTIIITNSSTRPRTQLPTVAKSQSIIRTKATWIMGNSTLRCRVEITLLRVEGENQQLIAMPIPYISQTRPIIGASSPTAVVLSEVKVRTTITRAKWILQTSVPEQTKQPLGSITLQSRLLLMAIMPWTRLSHASCKTSRIIDQLNSRASSSPLRITTEFSKIISFCLRQVPMQEC